MQALYNLRVMPIGVTRAYKASEARLVFWVCIFCFIKKKKPLDLQNFSQIGKKMKMLEWIPSTICKLLSKHPWQSLFLVKLQAFSIYFWTLIDGCIWSMKIILRETSYFRHWSNIQTIKESLQRLLVLIEYIKNENS